MEEEAAEAAAAAAEEEEDAGAEEEGEREGLDGHKHTLQPLMYTSGRHPLQDGVLRGGFSHMAEIAGMMRAREPNHTRANELARETPRCHMHVRRRERRMLEARTHIRAHLRAHLRGVD